MVVVALALGVGLAGTVRAGSLTPPGAPASTMNTMGELYQALTNVQSQLQDTRLRLGAVEQKLISAGMQQTSGDMVLIPAGSFVMGACTNAGQESIGDALPQHSVYVSACYMDKYEVASNLWRSVYVWATNCGYSFGNCGKFKTVGYPVHSVNWYQCVAWCNAHSQRDGFTPCYTNADGSVYTNSAAAFAGGCNWAAGGYRLPTEAEWEKAARGGVANMRFPWDDANTIQHARANYQAQPLTYAYDTSPTAGAHRSYDDGGLYGGSAPVGAFAQNGYGLFDMAGNLMEWCWDWYGADYYARSPLSDPQGPSSGTKRVCRGGNWDMTADCCRSAHRFNFCSPTVSENTLGFRCVRRAP